MKNDTGTGLPLSLWALLVAVAVLLACATPQPYVPVRTTRQRIADVPAPATIPVRVVNFAPLFENRVASNTVYAGKEKDLMKRVLLSPNVVFESSRSSVDEPKVLGPPKPTENSPYLDNALGEAVDIPLSSMLMAHLSQAPRSSLLYSPAVTKKWDPHFWCIGTKDCFEATWVERLLLLQQKSPAGKEARESFNPEVKLDELPTCALAVRRLGTYLTSMPVIAVENPTTKDLDFRIRRSPNEASVCGVKSLSVPVVQFQAEIVSMRDGRILARIDESRYPALQSSPRREVHAVEYVPVSVKGYTEYLDERPNGGEYAHVVRYDSKDVVCERAVAEFERMVAGLRAGFEALAASTTSEVFHSSLDPLYTNAP